MYNVQGVDFATLTYSRIPASSNAAWDAATADWNANGYRLPTEMEWMWAAMGAENTPDKPFAGATGRSEIGDYAVIAFHSTEPGRTRTERTNPVGSKLPNELGLYDMSGNVAEWCWDRYGPYPEGRLTDYAGVDSGSQRVIRGGAWSASNSSGGEVARRSWNNPESSTADTGFRVVLRLQ